MNVAIVYDSRTGTTATAARAMAVVFKAKGHPCIVRAVRGALPAEVAKADLICVGSWTRGLVLFGQRATDATMMFVDRLGNLGGKKAVVFCTYKIATGRMLTRMAAPLQQKGADVVAQFKFRGETPTEDFSAFVQTLSA